MLLNHVNPRDGVTRCFGYGKPMVGNDGKVKDFYLEAKEKGIKFDVGHGNNSFSFSMAVPASSQGFGADKFHRFTQDEFTYLSGNNDRSYEQILDYGDAN